MFLPNYLVYLIGIFFVNLSISMLFRFIFLFKYYSFNPYFDFSEILYAIFNRGVMFDQKISCILIVIPFLILSIPYLFNIRFKILEKIMHIYISILIIFNILISIVDIPFFSFYNSRITKIVFNWVATPKIMLDFLTSTPFFLVYFMIFLVVIAVVVRFLNKIYSKHFEQQIFKNISFVKRFGIFLLFLFLIAFGIRGEYKFDSHPFVIKDAYFSKNIFVNQLSINPVFAFMDSFRYKVPDFFKDKNEAIDIVQKDLGIDIKNSKFASPIARKKEFVNDVKKYNIVLIFLESMSTYQMGRFGNHKNLTPNLDKLTYKSIFFNNFYSTGEHTFAGLYSVLTGYPIICGKNPMYDVNTATVKYPSMMSVFKKYGYNTAFFCSGKGKFDNMHTFLTNNDFDMFYEEKDFLETKYINSNGVYDHILFDFSIQRIDELSKQEKPFFATILTISAHKWNTLINMEDIGFKPKYTDQDDIVYEYADRSFGKFWENIKNKDWFDNTIFVIVGDHGQVFKDIPTNYPIPISYHKVPLLFYAPSILKPKAIDDLSSQLDVFPTLMGLLKMSYTDNTFGIDLFRGKRKYVYLSSENFEGILDDEYFFVTKPKETRFLYKYKDSDITNYANESSEIASRMEQNLLATLDVAQYMINNRLITISQEEKEDRKIDESN